MSNGLPQGWIPVQIAELCDVIKEKGCEGIAPYLEIGNVDIDSKRYVFTDKHSVKGCRTAKRYDVLISKVRPTRGAITWIREAELQISSAFTVLRNRGALADQYLWLYLAWNQYYFNHLGESCTGTMYPTTSDDAIVAFEVPLAPLPEQRRIVAKLELLLGKVDACEKRLARIPVILKRFRQSILAAACSGRLTADWREKNTLPLAPSPQGRGKKGATSQAPSPLEGEGWGEGDDLPEGWIATILKDVAAMRLGKMLDKSKNLGDPTPYLRNINVRWFTVDLSDIALMRATADDKKELSIKNGDLLVCEGGEPGRCAVWKLGENLMIFQKAIHRIRPAGNVSPHWLQFNLCNDANSGRLAEYFTGTTIKHLTGKALSTYGFPLPPLPEQQEIVRRVEALFDLADQIEARYTKAKAYVDKLTQSILAKAFRGELVPQDPNDEPASVLLERIKAERSKAQTDSSLRCVQRLQDIAVLR